MKMKKYMISVFIIVFLAKLLFEISEIGTSLLSLEMVLSILSAIIYGLLAMGLIGFILKLLEK